MMNRIQDGTRVRLNLTPAQREQGYGLWIASGEDEKGNIKPLPNGITGTIRMGASPQEAPQVIWDGITPKPGYIFALGSNFTLPSYLEVIP